MTLPLLSVGLSRFCKAYRMVPCLFFTAKVQLTFHSMDLLYGLREVDRKNDSFGMPALVTLRRRRGPRRLDDPCAFGHRIPASFRALVSQAQGRNKRLTD